jgi:hypothetical protein
MVVLVVELENYFNSCQRNHCTMAQNPKLVAEQGSLSLFVSSTTTNG